MQKKIFINIYISWVLFVHMHTGLKWSFSLNSFIFWYFIKQFSHNKCQKFLLKNQYRFLNIELITQVLLKTNRKSLYKVNCLLNFWMFEIGIQIATWPKFRNDLKTKYMDKDLGNMQCVHECLVDLYRHTAWYSLCQTH